MSVFSGVVVYVLIWWMVFFCMLPVGITTIDKPQAGEMPGAPVNPGMKRKVILTTLLSVLVWIIIYLIIRSGLISYHDIALKMRV